MIENFYMRFFNMSGSYMKVVTLWTEWDADSRNDTYLGTIGIGREFGKVIRILFDFHLTDTAKYEISQQYFLQ